MLWRIDGLADRFLYLNDDMMFVGPVQPADFFSNEGEVTLRGRWTSWAEQLEKNTFIGNNKLLGAENDGLHLGPFLLVQPRELSTAATSDGRTVRDVRAGIPGQCRVPLPLPQAALDDLRP
jgi:hypothetical protein